MPSSFSLAPMDPQVRWSVVDGTSTAFDLLVASRSNAPVLCTLTVDEPAGGGSIEPKSFTLLPGDSRTVKLTFDPKAIAAQTKRAVVSVRSADGRPLATLEHELIVGGETDCAIALAWQRPLLENGELRGFILSCAVKNTGPTRATFELQFARHPSLHFDASAPVVLQSGSIADVPVHVEWDRTERDMIGKNHPDAIDVFAETTKGRRTGRLPWQMIDDQCARYVKTAAAGAAPVEASASAAASAASIAGEPAAARMPFGAPAAAPTPIAAAVTKPTVVSAPATARAPAPEQHQPAKATTAGPTPAAAAWRPTIVERKAPPAQAVMPGALAGAESQAPSVKEAWMQRLPQQPSVSPLASAVTIVSEEDARHGETAAPRQPHPRRDPAVRYSTLVMVGVALIALVVAILYFFRPSPPAPAITSIAQITPLPASQATVAPTIPATRPARHARANKHASTAAGIQNPSTTAASGAAAGAAQQPAQTAQTTTPVLPSPATRRVATRPIAAIQSVNQSEPVSLYNVDASFERGGRAVRVFWESSGQAGAQIQLTNASGRVIGQRSVRGEAQTALLFLPRFYNGPVYVQLVAIGRQGDRVTESTQIGGL